MAKSRAQRKADRKKREEQLQRRAREAQAKARGADVSELSERTAGEVPPQLEDVGPPDPELEAEAELIEQRDTLGQPEVVPAAPAPARTSRREQRREAKERERRAKESARRREAAAAGPVKERGPVMGFFVSVWRELQRVQWPDRDTLIQASAVTLLFVAIAAAYLGALDAAFSELIKIIL